MRLLVRSFVCCVLATGARGQWYPPSSNVTVVYPPPAQNPPVVVVLDDPGSAACRVQGALRACTPDHLPDRI